MSVRVVLGGAIGFVAGYLIAHCFLSGVVADSVMQTMMAMSGFAGFIAGIRAGLASKAGNQTKALLRITGGAIVCVVIGLAMVLYRWFIR